MTTTWMRPVNPASTSFSCSNSWLNQSSLSPVDDEYFLDRDSHLDQPLSQSPTTISTGIPSNLDCFSGPGRALNSPNPSFNNCPTNNTTNNNIGWSDLTLLSAASQPPSNSLSGATSTSTMNNTINPAVFNSRTQQVQCTPPLTPPGFTSNNYSLPPSPLFDVDADEVKMETAADSSMNFPSSFYETFDSTNMPMDTSSFFNPLEQASIPVSSPDNQISSGSVSAIDTSISPSAMPPPPVPSTIEPVTLKRRRGRPRKIPVANAPAPVSRRISNSSDASSSSVYSRGSIRANSMSSSNKPSLPTSSHVRSNSTSTKSSSQMKSGSVSMSPPKSSSSSVEPTSSASSTSSQSKSLPTPRVQKRIPHNQVERKYRESLNSGLEQLRLAIPSLAPAPVKQEYEDDIEMINDDDSIKQEGQDSSSRRSSMTESTVNMPKPSKLTVLAAAVQYIKTMERECKRLEVERRKLEKALDRSRDYRR